jgi:ATPase subunit of ABC transporter with duplicated ATPase domains
MASILEVNNLSFSVNTKNLYNDVSFSVNKEDHLGIVGANGTGKSTLINLIINKLEADTGEIK